MLERLPPLDLAIVALYLLAIVGMSLAFAWRQRTGDDYFLAGRSMGRFPLAFSIMANQASAVSLVGAPAFVAIREGGGLRWLQYELAVPLSMLLLAAILLPALRSVPGASIYAYAETRYGRSTRRALAGSFLLARGLSLGVILYASALVVAEALGCSVDAALLAVGLFSVAYTSLGGIVADIWSDVLQLALLWGGMVFARSGAGILELVNKVGSAFYGPVLAVFVLGVLAPRVTEAGALVGLAAGLAGNLALAGLAPAVPWLWWNPAGFLVATAAALSAGNADFRWDVRWDRRESALLVGAFAAMVTVLAVLPVAVAWLD